LDNTLMAARKVTYTSKCFDYQSWKFSLKII
jgi:hypothetical protein